MLRIHEDAMFDTAHAALQAAIDRPRGIGVSSDIEVGCLGFLDGGTDLLTRELDRINSIRWRSDPATQHELEMGCTTSDLLSGCLAHFIGSITDGSQGGAAVTEIIRLPARTAKIAMPSRLRERFAAKDEAWPLQVALFDGLCQTILGSAHIAHRREAAPQHAHQHAGRSRRDIGRGPLGKPRQVCGDGGHMHMGIDQAGHQGHATQIKALHLAGMHFGPSDLQNAVSLDEDRAIRKIVAALGIQDSGVPKKIACHWSLLLPPFLEHLEFFTYALLKSQTKRSFL